MSAITRSRIPTGSSTWPVSCGPSSLITSMWIEFLRSANGSLVCCWTAAAGLVVTSRSWSSMRLLPSEAEQGSGVAAARRLCRGCGERLAIGGRLREEQASEVVEGRGRVRLRTRQRDRDALVHRAGDLAIGRYEDVRLGPEDHDHVVLADADARVGTVQDELDLLRVVVHQPERLEPELRVLERERVECADHDQIGARVDGGDHLGGEAGGRVGDDEVVRAPGDDENVAQELDRDRARLVGPGGGQEDVDARVVRHDVVRELVRVQ